MYLYDVLSTLHQYDHCCLINWKITKALGIWNKTWDGNVKPARSADRFRDFVSLLHIQIKLYDQMFPGPQMKVLRDRRVVLEVP